MKILICKFESNKHLQCVAEWLRSHGIPLDIREMTDHHKYMILADEVIPHMSSIVAIKGETIASITDFCREVFKRNKVSDPILRYDRHVIINDEEWQVKENYLNHPRTNDICFKNITINRYKWCSDIIGYTISKGYFPEVNLHDYVALTMIYEAILQANGQEAMPKEIIQEQQPITNLKPSTNGKDDSNNSKAIKVCRPDFKIRSGEIVRGKEISGRTGKASTRSGYSCYKTGGIQVE